MRLNATFKNPKCVCEDKGVMTINGDKADAADLFLGLESMVKTRTQDGYYDVRFAVQENLKPQLVVWDYKEDPTNLIMGILNHFGLYSYPVPSVEGSDQFGLIVSETPLSIKAIRQIDKDSQTSEILVGAGQ